MKACSKCGIEKSKSEFFYAANRKNNLDSWCRGCHAAKAKAGRPRKTLECYRDEVAKQCPKCREIKLFAEYFKSKSQRDGLYGYCKVCQRQANAASHAKHRKNRNAAALEKKNADPKRAMKARVLGLVRKSLDRRALSTPVSSVSGSFWAAVGYDPQQLADHLERQFLPGMTWERRREWHIDHITPIRKFSYESFECPEFAACWGLANLRPLWAKDNLQKGECSFFLL